MARIAQAREKIRAIRFFANSRAAKQMPRALSGFQVFHFGLHSKIVFALEIRGPFVLHSLL
jgi:hypothetical protein